jgi:hypothetical protein
VLARAVCLAAVLVLAGCGSSSLSAKSLQKSADAVSSSAAEAALVADDVAAGRTTHAFVSVHAPELGQAAQKEAETLRSAKGPDALRRKADSLAKVADQVDTLAQRVKDADKTEARSLAAQLRQAGKQAKSIGGGG